jgi:putative Ca2+/H+ antiporter (TMEM165/GDT1 family)
MPGGQLTEGFLKSWGMILVSEIGDKTFFIAAIMAMKNKRSTVFAGAIAALSVMTALSAALGWAAPNLISKKYTHYAAIGLFFFFGARSLWEAYSSSGGDSDELEEVEKEVQEKEAKRQAALRGDGSRKDHRPQESLLQMAASLLSPVFVEAFVLTFLAEWGDRSQIATIGLAASIDIVGVTLGGILGHSICTGAAVMGGRQLATHIQERTVMIVGGLLFIAFGIHACFETIE